MKKVLILIGILAVLSMAAGVEAIQAPHDDSNKMGCGDCHTAQLGQDASCLVCHINTTGGGYTKANAPFVKVHSSANTSTKYGTWTLQCKDCHGKLNAASPHDLEQKILYGSQSYLATGTLTVTSKNSAANTSLYTYSNISILRPEWSDLTKWNKKTGNDRGLILLNTSDGRVSHEIVSVDTINQTFTVTGVDANAIVGNSFPFAILYGQYIGHITRPDTSLVNVPFFSNSGASSFAHDETGTGTDPTPTGVCQVCHTQTTAWRSDGTLAAVGVHAGQNGANCTLCHPHEEGFKPAGCNTCHGFPPTVGNPPGPLGGPDGLAIPATGSTSAGAHAYHVNIKSYDCAVCHYNSKGTGANHNNTIVTLGFVNMLGVFTGGSYDGQATANYDFTDAGTSVSKNGLMTCSNIYCHSNAQNAGGVSSRTYAVPVWNDPASGQCGTCHKGDGVQGNASLMDSGKHSAHVAAPYNKACSVCHNGFGFGSADHVNNNINMAFGTDPFGTTGAYSQSPNTPGNGYGSCSNVYCHSIVQKDGAGALLAGSGDYSTPSWSGGAICGSCHSVPPASGKHGIHAQGGSYGFDCWICHNNAGINYQTGIPTSKHTNEFIDIAFNGSYATAATYSKGTAITPGSGSYGTCSATYCHSRGTGGTANPGDPRAIDVNTSPSWSGSLSCTGCHGNEAGNDGSGRPFYPNGTPKANSHAKHSTDCSICHSATTQDNITIFNKSKHVVNRQYDLQAKSGYTFSYTYAASGGTCSTISCHSNGTATWGGVVGCGGCHAAPPATGAHPAHSGALTSGTAQYGNDGKSPTSVAYGFNCGNCHPMDTNKHANGITEVELYNANATGFKANNPTAAGKTGSGLTTLCDNVYCHSNGAQEPVYKPTPVWGGNFAGDRCAGCHDNSPTGTPAHGKHVVGIHYATLYSGTNGLMTAGSGGTNSHGLSSTATTINCNMCHNTAVTTSNNDKNTICSGCHNGSAASLRGNAVIADKTVHVNGTPDVAFASSLRTKAQIRNTITEVPELNTNWTRTSGYKGDGSHDQAVTFNPAYTAQTRSCSSVACHNGYAVNWDAQNITCKSCHKGLTN